MSRMAKPEGRGSRRRFTDEFKAGVVRLVLDEGKTAGAVARELNLTDSAVRVWVAQAQADRTKGKTGLTTAERDELARLRTGSPPAFGPAPVERERTDEEPR